MLAPSLALTIVLSGCGFRVFAEGSPTPDSLIDDAPDSAVDAAVDAACAAPIVIDDVFDNADLATAGPQSIGGGFTPVKNVSAGNGTTLEASDLEIRTSNNNQSLAPAHGAASSTSFVFNPSGMTVRLVVTAADTPIWNGIAVALQSNPATIDSAGGSLVLRVRGQGTNSFRIDMGDQNPYDPPFGLEPYDEAELADGFEINWVLRDTTWSYAAEGLLANQGSITDSGAYGPGSSPATLLDATVHLAVHIQGNPNDPTPRVLRVRRLTLWDGVCP
ncbi:MAG: hypothetical protein ACKV2T_15600 [Kofleriaceae bacterium]